MTTGADHLVAPRRRIPALPVSSRGTAAAIGVVATLGLAASCWVVAVRQMKGMDMGVATELGSFGFFIGAWVSMMAAMMLPGVAAAVVSRATDGVRAVPLFLASYLTVWTLMGVVVYAVYRPHSTATAGAVTLAAGVYELTPLKRHFRRRCRESFGSGLGFGLCCVGSSIGLMAMLIVLGMMSVTWMAAVAVIVIGQKLLPAKGAIDVPVAVAMISFGLLILVAPSSVPGLTPPISM